MRNLSVDLGKTVFHLMGSVCSAINNNIISLASLYHLSHSFRFFFCILFFVIFCRVLYSYCPLFCSFFFVFQNVYAKAIYDNIAESPDELAFKRGDMLTVIEQDTDGLEGWWLCTLRGRQVNPTQTNFQQSNFH